MQYLKKMSFLNLKNIFYFTFTAQRVSYSDCKTERGLGGEEHRQKEGSEPK